MSNERKDYVPHHSGMPDEAYLRGVARQEYAWAHRMQIDPLEGFEQTKHLRKVTNIPHSVQDVLNGDGNNRLENRTWLRAVKPETIG